MNVALAYNVKKNLPSVDLASQEDLEFDSPEVTQSEKEAIESFGHKVTLVEADENAFLRLKKLKDASKVDIVFNIAEGKWGEARETQIPIICEILKIPYTHSGPTTHTISLDKSFTNLILKGADGVNVPDSHVVKVKETDWALPKNLKFPLIVKPNTEGSSKGVLDANIVHDLKNLRKRVEVISQNYTKEVLIEEFIDGREFTVAVMGNGNNVQVLPIIEQKFDFLPPGMNKIASFELKWIYEDALPDPSIANDCPAKLTTKQQKEIEETTELVYKVLDVKDCARLDYRMDKNGKLYFIEINTLPGMGPPQGKMLSYFPLAATTAGMSYTQMVGKILELACKRYGL